VVDCLYGCHLNVLGRLTLVDLAGSEKTAKSGVQGEQLKEVTCINQSLSALADVFSAIRNKDKHIPYRNIMPPPAFITQNASHTHTSLLKKGRHPKRQVTLATFSSNITLSSRFRF